MTDFLKLLRRFALTYKLNIALSILFNILTAFLTLFSFAFITPILQMLFNISDTRYDYMSLDDGSIKDVASTTSTITPGRSWSTTAPPWPWGRSPSSSW